VGDKVYGRKKPSLEINRQFLHAHQLMISLPGEDKQRTFEAALAPDLETVLNNLRN
jgi:23S rRNA-/tRNA-specific pseudouridylate synthase